MFRLPCERLYIEGALPYSVVDKETGEVIEGTSYQAVAYAPGQRHPLGFKFTVKKEVGSPSFPVSGDDYYTGAAFDVKPRGDKPSIAFDYREMKLHKVVATPNKP